MSNRLVLSGMTLMAACACGTAAGLSSVSAGLGVASTPAVFHVTLLGAGALLLVVALRARPAAWLPLGAALATLALAGFLAPARIMRDSQVFSSANLVGFALYPLAAGLFIWTLMRAYEPRQKGLAIGAMAAGSLVAGCTCCLTPGALRYLGMGTGLTPDWLITRGALVGIAFVTMAAILTFTSGLRPAFWLAAGITIVYPLEKLVEYLIPAVTVQQMNLAFLTRYPLWLVGTGMIFFAISYLLVPQTEQAGSRLPGRFHTSAREAYEPAP